MNEKEKHKRSREASWKRNKREATRNEILDFLGRRCAKCGFDQNVLALQIDHINGDGYVERAAVHGDGQRYYNNILKNLKIDGCDKYQILCANCNIIKKYENNENKPRIYEHIDIIPKTLRPCGTHSAYRRGCRCEECRLAHNTYCNNANKKSRAKPNQA